MTRLGWSALVLALAVTALGVTLRWPAALAIGVALLVVVLVALSTLVRPADVRIERRISPSRVRKGELAIAHLSLRNRARRSFPGAVGVQEVGGVEVEVGLPRLRRGEEDVRTSVLPTDRRGQHTVTPVVLRRSDPFGLVRVEQRHGGEGQLLVLPRVLEFRALHDSLTRSLEGVADDTTPHGTMTFHQMREYVPGDDIRRIHWPSTAKVAHTGQLVVRQDVDDAQPFVVVVVDTRAARYADAEGLELAIDAAASAVVAATTGRAPFELRTTGGERIGGPNHQAVDPALELLALADADAPGRLTDELTSVRRTRSGAVAVVVTGPADPDELAAVAALRQRFSRVLLLSITEEDPPHAGSAGVTFVHGQDAPTLTAAWNVAIRA
ncbi:DUF58 domain-containing protein [Nitriliruptor alkaliphilus]|uniref:DUF58 domain-containing protein n=1 Tax=Nitriliruptor alkaliphilus TaxID=427918 RepID=UPI000695DD3C|nr:DUF58 domain-containing protein [Nitriliruptor alkaliphilus]